MTERVLNNPASQLTVRQRHLRHLALAATEDPPYVDLGVAIFNGTVHTLLLGAAQG